MRPDPNTDYFHVIKDISDSSFTGVERTPSATLEYEYTTGEVFIRELDNQVVGYAICNRNFGNPYLWSIAVKKEYRGCGVASLLLEEIISFYKKTDYWIALSVHTDNPAQKLYFDHGFRVIKVLPKYYGKDNGLRMRRTL